MDKVIHTRNEASIHQPKTWFTLQMHWGWVTNSGCWHTQEVVHMLGLLSTTFHSDWLVNLFYFLKIYFLATSPEVHKSMWELHWNKVCEFHASGACCLPKSSLAELGCCLCRCCNVCTNGKCICKTHDKGGNQASMGRTVPEAQIHVYYSSLPSFFPALHSAEEHCGQNQPVDEAHKERCWRKGGQMGPLCVPYWSLCLSDVLCKS